MAAAGGCFNNSTQIGPTGTGLTFKNFYDSWIVQAACGPPSYVRPDDAGSILPWPYTLVWFLVHFPITLIRAHRWERVQALSIILAVITIVFQIQAYASGLEAESVLVWMPIFVVLDVGAMMQLVFLIIEDSGVAPLARAFRLPCRSRRRNGGNAVEMQPPGREGGTGDDDGERDGGCAEAGSDGDVGERGPNGHESRGVTAGRGGGVHGAPRGQSNERANPPVSDLSREAWIVFLAIAIGLALVSLQIYGLVYAVKGRQRNDITAKWCSTQFSGALSVQISCSFYNVQSSFSQGIGCIVLHGFEQDTWLLATIVIVSFSLAFQISDCIILSLVGGTERWRGIRMKRPWFTMFTGNIILFAVIIVGIIVFQRLPKSVDQRVTIYRFEPSRGLATACIGELVPFGVRGAVIGWTDGFLKSWGETYSPTHN